MSDPRGVGGGERVGLERVSLAGSRAWVAGRPALDPCSLGTLWVWALAEGIVSARALARRCDTDYACRWALGGRTVSHHTLSVLRQLPDAGRAAFADGPLCIGAGRCRWWTERKSAGGGGQFRERGGVGRWRPLAFRKGRGETAGERGAGACGAECVERSGGSRRARSRGRRRRSVGRGK